MEIRAHHQGLAIHADRSNIDISLPLPGTANLQKPFTAQALLAKLGELLNN